jgi:hypothetical protein
MDEQFSIAQTFLRLFVILMGIEIVGGLHETIVVTTLWSLASPDSVVAYYQYNVSNPQFALNADGRFWIFFTPLVGLLAIVTLISSRKLRLEHSKWRTTSAILGLIVVVFTFAWFVPNIILIGQGGAGRSEEQIISLMNWWVMLNWVRAVLCSAALLAAMRALSVPPNVENNIKPHYCFDY